MKIFEYLWVLLKKLRVNIYLFNYFFYTNFSVLIVLYLITENEKCAHKGRRDTFYYSLLYISVMNQCSEYYLG